MLTTIKKKLEGAQKILVLGIGSELRGDDAAGLLVAEKLAGKPGIEVIIGGTAPENFTGEIKRIKPSHLIIVDTAEIGEKPGSIRIIEPKDIDGYSFSTHSLPMKVMVDYLAGHFPFTVLIIGIQPRSLEFGMPVAEEVEKAAEEVAGAIENATL